MLPTAEPRLLARAVLIVRVTVAVLLGIHGWHRAFSGTMPLFGDFLESHGLPAGEAVAWAITAFEIGASVLLAAGRYVRFVVPGFALILLGGIATVHASEGWFVVGAGRNGVEFSVLLLACLAALWLAHPPPKRDV